ncbi:DUF1330 domain-containing protein [Leucobacter komagatae]|uniref:DUF1330 domain-containing protein n=1 Tax=Leucobacter komagatae TaxID=55969 RepID=A0A0D0IQP0_9MICO|nr:DUF1330 domain-containing protein [Leucobacter komagatae]KIP53342.1 hypothetical protein SD72_03665 [Leucobacter komagatae]
MSAYAIINARVLDEEAGAAYVPLAAQSIAAHGGRYLVAGPTPVPIEGSWDAPQIIIVEFDSMQQLRDWYDSAEYRVARELRAGKIQVDMLFADGVPGA